MPLALAPAAGGVAPPREQARRAVPHAPSPFHEVCDGTGALEVGWRTMEAMSAPGFTLRIFSTSALASSSCVSEAAAAGGWGMLAPRELWAI